MKIDPEKRDTAVQEIFRYRYPRQPHEIPRCICWASEDGEDGCGVHSARCCNATRRGKKYLQQL
jgi:hypothetical protein